MPRPSCAGRFFSRDCTHQIVPLAGPIRRASGEREIARRCREDHGSRGGSRGPWVGGSCRGEGPSTGARGWAVLLQSKVRPTRMPGCSLESSRGMTLCGALGSCMPTRISILLYLSLASIRRYFLGGSCIVALVCLVSKLPDICR